MTGGRAWPPGTRFCSLRMFLCGAAGVGAGVAAWACAGGGGLTGQKRMVAGPLWRVLAAWSGFLTG